MVDRVGQQLGSYRLIRLLGQGGFAEVYLCQHVRLNSYAAAKVLNARLAGSDADSFQREAHTIARLLHPHIIRVFDYDIAEGAPFLIMDYAPNGTVCNAHPKGTRVPLAQVVSYVKQVADALHYAHNEKVIHRDIKPENMLLGRNNEVLLSDFGIATVTQTQSSRSQLTRDIVGTVAYMSPEQLQGKPQPASDQYSLGIVIYEWLTGERPFQGSFTEIAIQHVMASPRPLREKIPGIPPQLEEVIMVALAKEPHKRFASMQSFSNAFEQASASGPSFRSMPAPIPGSPRDISPPPIVEEVVTTGPTIPVFTESSAPANTPFPAQSITPPRPAPAAAFIPMTPGATPGPGPVQRSGVFSRRVVLGGLVGLVAVGGGLAALALAHPFGIGTGPAFTPTAGPSGTGTHSISTSTPVTPTGPPVTGSWSTLPTLPSPEADNVAIYARVQQRGYIYMSGGFRGTKYSPRHDDNLYRYDIAASQWGIVTSNFPGMFNNSVVLDAQNNFFFTGGFSPDSQVVTPLVYKYQPDTGALVKIVPPSTIVFGYGGSMIADQRGYLYITQGFMQVFGTRTFAGRGWYRYDIALDQWKVLAPLPVGVGYTVLAPDRRGGIVMMGGTLDTEEKQGITDIYRYSIASDTWTKEQIPAPQAFNGVASCDLGNGKVVVVGGYDPVQNITLDNTWLIDLLTLHSTALATLPGGSRLGAATYDGAGNVYLVRGASNNANAPTQDFWRLILTS
jgi:serine/threonine protein kinase/N-acetylneuraminic acid mutarotase